MIIKKHHLHLLRNTFQEFFRDLPLLHSAALSYYTLMALAPMMYLGIFIIGSYIGQDKVLEILATVMKEYVGVRDITGIMDFLSQFDFTRSSLFLKITGGVAIVLSMSAIINSLKKSINKFYGLEFKPIGAKKVIIRNLLSRLISMAFILGIGIVIMAIYFVETVILSLDQKYFGERAFLHWFTSILIQHVLPILTNFMVFAFVFKYLHDGIVRWGIVIRGAALTSVMLYLGQLLIKFYLANYFFASGAGFIGTILVLIVWVYYSAIFLFLGVKMTATYARLIGEPIQFRD